jgi:hypothetical protein
MGPGNREYVAALIMRVAIWMGCVVGYALVPSYVVHELGRSSELVLASAVVIVDALGRFGFAATTKKDALARAIPGALIFLILPILPMIFSDYADLKSRVSDEPALTAWAWNYFWLSCAGGFFATLWTEA